MRVLKEGTRLADRYVLKRHLGTGGMSQVWLAHDRRSDSEVALKFLSPELSVDPGRRELFHREWRVSSRLMHAHIARVFEYHDDPDGPYYSQQFVAGPEIRVLAGEAPEVALAPLGLIADALRYAHAKGVVHCDVKAANVLLDRRGAPYLIDFGVATGGAGSVAAPGGSAIAASPARLAGEPPSPADDIYALGVLMHELLTGAPPMPPGTVADGENLAYPKALGSLVASMLSLDPAKRPGAEEVVQSLAAAGITPGTAPVRLVRGHGMVEADIPVDTPVAVQPLRPHRKKPDAPAVTPARAREGVSPGLVWGGLAVLLALFVSIIFWLPQIVERPASDPDRSPTGALSDTPAPAADANALTDTADGQQSSADDGADDPAIKAATDEALGELLARLERLQTRGIDRWGGQAYRDALDLYEQGDRAYLDKDYRLAGTRYREVDARLDPFFDRVDVVFEDALREANDAFTNGNAAEAVRLFELAVAITPGHAEAQRGLARARNLDAVLQLTEQGFSLEKSLDLEAAKRAFQQALDLDDAWQPAADGLARINQAILQRTFEQRMTEGLDALAGGEYASARAAFNAARDLKPDARQPVDGLLQVDQEVRLARIRSMEQEASRLEAGEQWQEAIVLYEKILEVDADLQFARAGLERARSRAVMHDKLEKFISDPDSLSAPGTMQVATQLLLTASRTEPMGPRLEDQKNELSRLLKRAATPLTVQLVSDNATEVSIFRVGKLGTFASREISLRPGSYVALGSRQGFRDVRLEFRVAPETDMRPVVVICEERI